MSTILKKHQFCFTLRTNFFEVPYFCGHTLVHIICMDFTGRINHRLRILALFIQKETVPVIDYHRRSLSPHSRSFHSNVTLCHVMMTSMNHLSYGMIHTIPYWYFEWVRIQAFRLWFLFYESIFQCSWNFYYAIHVWLSIASKSNIY